MTAIGLNWLISGTSGSGGSGGMLWNSTATSATTVSVTNVPQYAQAYLQHAAMQQQQNVYQQALQQAMLPPLSWTPLDNPGYDSGVYRVPDGQDMDIKLPDGTLIKVAKDGSFAIEDAGAKVTYRANRLREFNAYVSASDLLAEFVAYAGQHGVARRDFMGLPIELFIRWLVIEAAKQDGEPTEQLALPFPDQNEAVAA